jgi:molecular chaperone GrpE (heat shock protein)
MVESNNNRSSFIFRLACFNQAFKEQVNSQFGFFQPVKTVDPKVDTAIDKLNRLKKYIKQTEDNVKKMINGMKTTMNAQKQFAFVSKDAKLKGDEAILKQKLNLVSDSLSSSSKDIECLYLPAMENFHEWLKIFLDKAIRDAEDSVSNYNTVRTEMDTATDMIAQTKQRLSTEINGSQEYRRVTSILRGYEQTYKIKKAKYELLCEEVIQKIELLEAKRKADMPNYLQSVYDSMHIFYNQTVKNFPESGSSEMSIPTPSTISK